MLTTCVGAPEEVPDNVHTMESTQPANVGLVQRLYETFEERDLDGMLALVSPTMEFFPQVTASIVDRKEPYVGHEGLRRYFEDAARVWKQLDIIPHEYHDLGDRVLVLGRVYARGEGGYISDSPAAWLWRIEGDLIAYGRVFTSRAEAFEAAGVES
jgi:ketosteroid isomerase-like protein